ncbi:hypothetical protein [Stutzerimonas degradans]|uniref:hypothetical protein n=1 Tax=Stutzerimonas degradans TaxID=2968968 RepID=UPI00028CC010|nr:hypothetical protein [Stutzerimonas degradans]EKM95619.1 hypothetical protein C211_12687 [Stutzerimonas degradans]NHW01865.1 hypothetical protein [Stutzerimonas degradans]
MMTPAFTLTLMLFGWFLVALALLWGMMRIARRHPRPRALHHDHSPTKIFSLPLPFRKIF